MSFNPLPIMLCAVGTYFLVKLRFFFIIHPIRSARRAFSAFKDKRTLRAFTLALAGTLGVGNVYGVAVGIIIGGAGSVFWLLISMLFAMTIKYAEVVISTDSLTHDTDAHGGMFLVIRSAFRRRGGALCRTYALVLIALALFMGAALQSASLRHSVSAVIPTPRVALAVILLALVAFSIFKGAQRIEKITSIIIPLTTIVYIILTLSIIVINFRELPRVIGLILKSALSFKSGLGGLVGFLLSAPLNEGFARGILSNEAGAGTSSMAHARSGALNPASAGMLGMLEVWFDTGVVCMLTALSILTSMPVLPDCEDGMELIMRMVGNSFGYPGKLITALAVVVFAFATVICWYYYGSEAFRVLFGNRYKMLFLPLFLFFVAYGVFADSASIIHTIDVLMALAVMITVSALIKSSDRIKALSERGGALGADYKCFRKLFKGSVLRRGRSRRAR